MNFCGKVGYFDRTPSRPRYIPQQGQTRVDPDIQAAALRATGEGPLLQTAHLAPGPRLETSVRRLLRSRTLVRNSRPAVFFVPLTPPWVATRQSRAILFWPGLSVQERNQIRGHVHTIVVLMWSGFTYFCQERNSFSPIPLIGVI